MLPLRRRNTAIQRSISASKQLALVHASSNITQTEPVGDILKASSVFKIMAVDDAAIAISTAHGFISFGKSDLLKKKRKTISTFEEIFDINTLEPRTEFWNTFP
jgi:CRISPR/Cas system CMR-associated protein Cmr3 (group 5 of RAMP superfamily)